MTNYRITLKGLEASITIEHGHETDSAYGILFDENAAIIRETESQRYSGFCDREITYSIACTLYDHARQVEPADIWDALSALTPECECD